jgi:uncharacterized protein
MASFEVPARLLAPRVPPGTRLDLWQGKAFVSVVAFQFLDTKVLGAGIPGHRNFEEVNLRFYVMRDHPDGPRRGVVFIREIVPRRLVAFAARLLYNEPYVARPTRSSITPPVGATPGRVAYGWKSSRGWNELEASVQGEPRAPSPASLDAFIAEHSWGYNVQRNGGTMEYRVEHPAWGIWAGSAGHLRADFNDLDDPGLATCLQDAPTSLFVADGSPVAVFRGQRIG